MKHNITRLVLSSIIVLSFIFSPLNYPIRPVQAAPLGAQPINDAWYMHKNVSTSVPYTETDDNTDATSSAIDPYFSCVGPTDQGMGSVWYRVILTADGTLSIDTFGSTTDTVLGVWGNPAGMDPQDPSDWPAATVDSLDSCNDDFDILVHGTDSKIELHVVSTDVIFIEVATARDFQGAYTLNVNFTPDIAPTDTATATLAPTDTATATPIPTDTTTATIAPSATVTASPLPTDTATATTAPSATETASPLPTDTETATIAPSSTATTTNTIAPTLTSTSSLTATAAPTSTSKAPTATPKPLYAYHLVQSGNFGSQTPANCRAIGYAQKVNSGTGTVYIRIYVDDVLVAGKYTAKGGGINFDLLSLPGNPITLDVAHKVKLMAILQNGLPYDLINPLTHQAGGTLTCSALAATSAPTGTSIAPTKTNTPVSPTSTTAPTRTNTSAPLPTNTPKATATPKPLYAYNLVQSGNYGSQTNSNCRAIGYAKKVSGGTGTVYIRIYVDDILVSGKYTARGGGINFDLLALPGNPFTTGAEHNVKLMAILENGQPYNLVNPLTHLPGGLLTCQ